MNEEIIFKWDKELGKKSVGNLFKKVANQQSNLLKLLETLLVSEIV